MRIPRVFYDGELSAKSTLNLNKEQAHYLGTVLRLRPGRSVILFNDSGSDFLCDLAQLDKKSGAIEVREEFSPATESPLKICMALGLSKGDRFDVAIQKATELGVTQIQPLFTERTEVRLNEDRLSKKIQHWRGVVQSASEQSGRTRLPKVQAPADFDTFIRANAAADKLVLDPQADTSLPAYEFAKDQKDVTVLIGPEGGLSQQEIERSLQAGFTSVSLGPRILRTETAPIASISVIQARIGDW